MTLIPETNRIIMEGYKKGGDLERCHVTCPCYSVKLFEPVFLEYTQSVSVEKAVEMGWAKDNDGFWHCPECSEKEGL